MDGSNYATQAVREAAVPAAIQRVAKSIEEIDALAAQIERKVASVSMPPSPKLDAGKEPCAPQPIKPQIVTQLDGLNERLGMIANRLRNQIDRIELTQ